VEESQILVSRHENLAFLQIIGRGSFQNAHLVKSFYTELLKAGVFRFVIDLNRCSYLDSTFLGTLAGLGSRLRSAGGGKLHIVNVTSRNMELLQNLGLDRLFAIDVCALDYEPTAVEPLPTEPKPTAEETGRNMLEAHLALIDASPQNLPKFKDVVTFLKEDLAKKTGSA
jgi:anti-anti-sigma factor